MTLSTGGKLFLICTINFNDCGDAQPSAALSFFNSLGTKPEARRPVRKKSEIRSPKRRTAREPVCPSDLCCPNNLRVCLERPWPSLPQLKSTGFRQERTANPISSPGSTSRSKLSPRIPLENFRATTPEEKQNLTLCQYSGLTRMALS